MLVQLNYNKTKTFEVVLYLDHEVEDFRPPYRIKSMHSQTSKAPALSPAYVQAILNLVTTARGVLDAFLNMTYHIVQAAPIIHYIRVCYAMSVLLELYMSSRRQGNELGKIIDADTLRIEHYLSSLQDKLEEAAGAERCRAPEKFKLVLRRMSNWYSRQHTEDSISKASEQDLRPLANLKMEVDSHTAHNASAPASTSVRGPSLQKPPFRKEPSTYNDRIAPQENQSLGSTPQNTYTNPGSSHTNNTTPFPNTIPPSTNTSQPIPIDSQPENHNFAIDPTFHAAMDTQMPMEFDDDFLSLIYSTSDSITNSLVPNIGDFDYMDEGLLDGFPTQ